MFYARVNVTMHFVFLSFPRLDHAPMDHGSFLSKHVQDCTVDMLLLKNSELETCFYPYKCLLLVGFKVMPLVV